MARILTTQSLMTSLIAPAFAPAHRVFPSESLSMPRSARHDVSTEARTRHPVLLDHAPHLVAALDWMARAQDVTSTGGISRGFSHDYNRFFKLRGWEPDCPETTAYTIPTLFAASDRFHRDDLSARAIMAATWETSVQLSSGAVQGEVIGQRPTSSVFNTGQAILGWLAAWERTGDQRFAASARRGAEFLIAALDPDGIWRRGHSQYAVPSAALYNARTAWALAEAGRRLNVPHARDAAARALRTVARRQHASGWIPDCCVLDAGKPLLHSIAYAARGLLEGGRELGDTRIVSAAMHTAEALAEQVTYDGRLAGRYMAEWRGAARWNCLSGQAQMITVWIRLHDITGDERWLEPVGRSLDFLKGTQDRTSQDSGIAGGLTGSEPVWADYAPHETLSWATKFFIDALLRHERVLGRMRTAHDDVLVLA